MSRTDHSHRPAPKAIGTYSQAVRVGDTVYVSGQIPLDPATMQLVTGDIDAEIRRVFDNLKAVAEAAGGTLANAAKVTVFLTDLAHFAKVNEIMATYFQEPYPARAAVGVSHCPRARASRWSASCTSDAPRRSSRSTMRCSSCRRATKIARASRRSARCSPACARWSKAKCSSPKSCSGGGARCWCASPTARAS